MFPRSLGDIQGCILFVFRMANDEPGLCKQIFGIGNPGSCVGRGEGGLCVCVCVCVWEGGGGGGGGGVGGGRQKSVAENETLGLTRRFR